MFVQNVFPTDLSSTVPHLKDFTGTILSQCLFCGNFCGKNSARMGSGNRKLKLLRVESIYFQR